MTQRNVERMLTEQAAPRPPEGLAERIKAEIPDPLEAGPVFRDDTDIVRLPRRQYWQLAAAISSNPGHCLPRAMPST